MNKVSDVGTGRIDPPEGGRPAFETRLSQARREIGPCLRETKQKAAGFAQTTIDAASDFGL
ncbi:hypothetical protein [Methylobacterium sp. Leaf118]|uniref:hypothetical protein n=1 Tax=Methylobacterium sp. Leaf118 TaxID=2876562 RepID=UPI001E5FE9E5|nr:hypothetical protein [Methylobacterium sp. Leaf118]